MQACPRTLARCRPTCAGAQVREKKSHLARLETTDMGKPIDEAEWDMDDVAGCFNFYAGLAEGLDAKQYTAIDVGMDDFRVRVRKDALGVVALITPWNYPLLMATVRCGAAAQAASLAGLPRLRLQRGSAAWGAAALPQAAEL